MSRKIVNLLIILCALTIPGWCEPDGDKVTALPGYDKSFTNRAFAGYLNTSSDARMLHYLFVESNSGSNNSLPITIWMNGGPGCTSKMGFVQQITPYCLNDGTPYTSGMKLQFNRFGWLNLTNLLFIDSPAGVGYSINNDLKFVYNDANTAKDNIDALKHFFRIKFEFYAKSKLYIAGESYAGKYIPDLAQRILSHNAANPDALINLKGIFLANPLLNFAELESNRVQFMISHQFVDPKLFSYWQKSCKTDPESAGCSYFYERYQDLVYRIDEYNIYGQCYGRQSQSQKSLMARLSLKLSQFNRYSKRYGPDNEKLKAGEWCSYDWAIQKYLNDNRDVLKSDKDMDITVCNMTIYNKYKADPKGSMLQIPSLLQRGVKVFICSGDWDDVVPFTDSYQNLNKMGLRLLSNQPWVINSQHSGFKKKYSYGLMFYLVKGAGHEVPLFKRQQAYNIFNDLLMAN